jgi:hypothetical protein
VEWLSDEWVQASGSALAEVVLGPDVQGVVAVELTGPGGGTYWRRWAGGKVVDGGSGKPETAPELTVTLSDVDARAFWKGSWSPSVAFMRGRLKMTGDMGILLPLLAATATPAFAAPQRVVDSLVG